MNTDVTERNRMQGLLREREQEFESLAENLPDLVARFDREYRIVYLNSAVEKLLGARRQDLLGKTQRELRMPEAFVGMFERSLDQSVREEKSHSLEFSMVTPAGERLFEAYHVPERDATGRVATVLCVARDITERKRAEEALRESEERFRQLAENIRQVFWITTPAGDHVDYVSPAYEELWGRSRESLYRNPRSWMESIHPDDLPAVQVAQERMPGGQSTDVEYRIVRPDGTLRWIRDCSYPTKRSDGTMLRCGIAEDITSLKLAEHERLTHAIHQRDALVREVHHRIKNSLQGVVGLLRSKIRSKPAAAQDIRAAIAQIQSIALVYGLQSKPSGGAISLAEILEAICNSVGNLAGGFIDRQFRRESEGTTFLAENEAVPIAVVLNELIFNGLKHSQATRGERRIRVALSRQANVAVVTMTNRGALPAEFDFKSGRCVGVGLDLVRTLLSPKGSKLAFRPGRGTVEVTLELRPPLIVVQKISAVA